MPNRVPIVQGHGRSGPEGLTFGIALGGVVAVVLAVVPLRYCTFPPAPVRGVDGYLIDGPRPLTPGRGTPCLNVLTAAQLSGRPRHELNWSVRRPDVSPSRRVREAEPGSRGPWPDRCGQAEWRWLQRQG